MKLMRFKSLALSLIFISLLFSCKKDHDQNEPAPILNEKFNTSAQSWTGDFADYPVGQETFYQLSFSHAQLPAPLDQSAKGIRIAGNNHSDDLFMFIKKKISGLTPNQTCKVKLEVELASDSPAGESGVGGAPGESVTVKGGLTAKEPVKLKNAAGDFYELNLDKGHQSSGGADLKALGDISNGGKREFRLIKRSGEFTGHADKDGNAWIIIGTDSGFEATTVLYYTQVKVTILP